MTEYLPPDGMTLDAAAAVLAGVADEEGAADDSDRTFYDTFDGLLHAAGLSLAWESGSAVLLESASGRELARCRMPQPTAPLLASALPDGPLRAALAPVSGIRALLALVHVHSRVRALRVLDGERKTVVRMSLEAPALVAAGGAYVPLRPRLRVAAVLGYDPELPRIQERLECEFGFRRVDQPLVDEAVRAAGGAPAGISAKPDVPLSYNQRADEAVALVLRRLFEVIEANRDGTIADIDTEFLHDFRVSVRRTRAVQRECRGVFPEAELARFRTEFRWLQQITGESRDLDVYVLEFDDYRAMVPSEWRDDLAPLLRVLRGRRDQAHQEMVGALRSERASNLRLEWDAFLERLPGLTTDDRPDATRAIGALSGERIRRVYRQMVRMGRAIDAGSPPEAYHELRKKGKELRYLLELFAAPVYPAEVVKPMIKALKGLQDVLGRHQDREVQVGTIRALGDEVAALPGGPAALMAMGVLVERLGEDARAARRDFAERFGVFASRTQRGLVKDTFS